MQTSRLLLSFVFFFHCCVCAVAYEHPGGMHPQEQLDFVKHQIQQKQQPYYEAYLQLIAYADTALLHTDHALADFNVPGYYVDAQMHRTHSRGLQSDAFDAYACALAYQLSGQEQYARKSLDFLMAWAQINTKYSNHDGSLVMAYSGTALINAAELLFPYEKWKESDKKQFLSWVRKVYREATHEIRNKKNNWADWGRLGSILTAHLLDDTTEVTENIRLMKSDLFHKIAADGHMPEEVRREANGIWYTYFSLAPITAACWVALQAEGTDLFTYQPEGRSIKSALDYLFYHNQHPEQWKWFENPRTGSPDAWPGVLFEAMQDIYGEEKYGDYVGEARPLCHPLHHFAWTFPTLMKPMRAYEDGRNTTEDLEILRERVVTELLEPAVDERHIENMMDALQEDGSWPDINYEDVSRTGFEHSRHLENMQELSRAYRKPGSNYRGDPALKHVIGAALDFWLTHDFICDNWWWNQIGTPDRMVSILLLMDEALTEVQKEKAIPIASRANLSAWGARPGGDRIKIAGIWGRLGLFKRDSGIVEEAVNTMVEEIRFAIERGTPDDIRGLQPDLSFHHRQDRVTSTLSYGLGYAEAFAHWAALVADTPYRFTDEKIKLLVDFYLDGICQTMVYGKYPDPGAKNRSITREGTLQAATPEIPEKLLQATEYRKKELEAIVKIRKGEQAPQTLHNKFFWHSEYLSHQRPAYFTSVRMFSSRNHSMEEPYNGEGLMNHHLGDGANFISRTGKEYFDIFPVWDWQKIPGTTVVQKPSLPDEEEIQKKGLTAFVGAVSDGRYGAAAFDFKSPLDPLEARKAWFFFDEEYVSLGAGIHSKATHPVATTLNQCLLNQEVVVMQNNQQMVLDKGTHHLKGVQWLLHDSVAYLFPAPTEVHLTNQEATGSWFRINRQADSPKEEISKDLFKVWLDHGKKPKQATYAYIVVPAIAATDLQDYGEKSPIKILANTPEQQAVQHTGLQISQVVMYKAGELQLTEALHLAADEPCVVMVQAAGPSIKKITVAYPSRKIKTIQLKVTARMEGSGDHFKAVWHEAKGYSTVTVDLPQEAYAGQSVILDMQAYEN